MARRRFGLRERFAHGGIRQPLIVNRSAIALIG
jgi:hypothetical protein